MVSTSQRLMAGTDNRCSGLGAFLNSQATAKVSDTKVCAAAQVRYVEVSDTSSTRRQRLNLGVRSGTLAK